MAEWLDFGKHTSYVLSAFSLTAVVLLANIVAAKRRLANRQRHARRRLAAEDS
jgi:heme exporter protein CcmD